VDKCRNDVVGVFPNAVELLRLASSLCIYWHARSRGAL